MASESKTLTQKLGGNQTLVLVVVVVLLLCFTVASEVMPALGMRGDAVYIQFQVGGRAVKVTGAEFQGGLAQWQRFNRPFERGGQEAYLTDLMQDKLALEAGIRIPDEALRQWIQSRTWFHDVDGEFDRPTFDRILKETFGGLGTKAFEEELRRFLRLEQYNSMFAPGATLVSDEEAFTRWKVDHAKVKVAYTWQPVAPLREELKPEDVSQEEIDRYWLDARKQKNFETKPRRTFDACWVVVQDVDDAAFDAAREARTGNAAFEVSDADILKYWSDRRKYDFNLEYQDEEMLEKLRAQNPDAPEPAGKDEDGEEPPKDGSDEEAPGAEEKTAPYDLPDDVQLARYWHRHVLKELWLRNYVTDIIREARDSGKPLAEVAEAHVADGLGLQILRQEEPVDQYEVETLPGVGFPTSGLRFALNTYDKSREGALHTEVVERSPLSDKVDTRGWLAFQVQKVFPAAIPPLEEVKDKVVAEILDERARDRARTRLEELRQAVQSSGGTLQSAAPGQGFEVETTDHFNEFSWRPPLPRLAPGEDPPSAADQWRNRDRRVGAVLGRYFVYRNVPANEFPPVVDDTLNTGAFYLVQVLDTKDPRFEEMTQNQKQQVTQRIQQERGLRISREMSYDALVDRLGLTIDGKPAPKTTDKPVEDARR